MKKSQSIYAAADELFHQGETLPQIIKKIRAFILDHASSLEDKRRPRTIIESRFTPPQKAFEQGMLSCGAMTNITAEMLRHYGFQVRLIHGENAKSVDHAWLKVMVTDTDHWEEFDITRPMLDVPATHKIKFQVNSWDEIKEQIVEDSKTLNARRRARVKGTRPLFAHRTRIERRRFAA